MTDFFSNMTEKMQRTMADMLREQGWTCTPPPGFGAQSAEDVDLKPWMMETTDNDRILTRTFNALEAARVQGHIESFADLVEQTRTGELLKYRNIGRLGYKRVADALKEDGFLDDSFDPMKHTP